MNKDGKNIKLLALDVDGTLTDGGIYVLGSGEQFRKFNAKDGLGVKLAVERGLYVGIISHSLVDGMINKRAEMMGVTRCYVGQAPKLDVLNSWCRELNIGLEQVAYVGDDVNDLPVIQAVGLSACPADATAPVLAACDVVLSKIGGEACVREFLDRFLTGN